MSGLTQVTQHSRKMDFLKGESMFKRMRSYAVAGMCVATLSQISIAKTAHMWIPLNAPNGPFAIDYYSIKLDGATPTLSIKQNFVTPIMAGNISYSSIVHQYSVDCANQLLVRSTSRIFIEQAELDLGAAVQAAPGNDRIPLGQMKSICFWRDHGFNVPDIGIKEDWEEMDSPVSSEGVFEAPKSRQRKNGIVLIKQKNEVTPNRSIGGTASHYGVVVSEYDCAKQEAHAMIFVRYDLAMNPIIGGFFNDASSLPKIEANRDRFASTCK
jgi:hypothetical protein